MTTSNPPVTIWYDTKFYEDGHTIDLLSIGMVRGTTAQPNEFSELYLINREFDLGRAHRNPWLVENVLPHLPVEQDEAGMYWWNPDHPDYQYVATRREIASAVFRFTGLHAGSEPVRLVSWSSSYDHTALMQLYGPMSKRPEHLPTWTYDLSQRQAELGVTDEQLPQLPEGIAHNALADAWHHQQIDYDLRKRALLQSAR